MPADFDSDGLCDDGVDDDDDNDGSLDVDDSDDQNPNVCSDTDADTLRRLHERQPLRPVERRCGPGQATGLCDRVTAIRTATPSRTSTR